MPLGHTDARQETTKKDKIAERRKIWLISLFSFTFFIILSIVFSNKSDTIYQQSSISQQTETSSIPYSNDSDRATLCKNESIKEYGEVDKWFYCGCYCGIYIDDVNQFDNCNNECVLSLKY